MLEPSCAPVTHSKQYGGMVVPVCSVDVCPSVCMAGRGGVRWVRRVVPLLSWQGTSISLVVDASRLFVGWVGCVAKKEESEAGEFNVDGVRHTQTHYTGRVEVQD